MTCLDARAYLPDQAAASVAWLAMWGHRHPSLAQRTTSIIRRCQPGRCHRARLSLDALRFLRVTHLSMPQTARAYPPGLPAPPDAPPGSLAMLRASAAPRTTSMQPRSRSARTRRVLRYSRALSRLRVLSTIWRTASMWRRAPTAPWNALSATRPRHLPQAGCTAARLRTRSTEHRQRASSLNAGQAGARRCRRRGANMTSLAAPVLAPAIAVLCSVERAMQAPPRHLHARISCKTQPRSHIRYRHGRPARPSHRARL